MSMPSREAALREALQACRDELEECADEVSGFPSEKPFRDLVARANAALDAPEPTTSDAEFLCDMANLMELSWRPEFKDVHVGGSQATIKRLREIADRLEPCTVDATAPAKGANCAK